ncbi:MAG: tetratricopeptide repeat protein [Isosphaerales bacterium]
MEPGRGTPRFKRRKRWVLAFVLFLIALVVGVVAAPRLSRSRSPQDPKRLALLQAAWKEFAARQYDRASAILDQRASEVAPTSLDWMLRARIAESQERPAEALDHLKHIPDADPISAQAWLKAGQIELARGRARAAEAAYRHALSLNPGQIQSYRELAYLYAVQRRKAECDAQFRALYRLMTLDYTHAFAWCQNYCWLWDVEGARKALIRFVSVDPTDRWSRLALATSYELTGHFEEAETALRPLLNSDPDARALRVQIAIERGEIEAAEDLARDGPADHVGLNIFRGRLALQRNDLREAAAYFRAARRQDPEDRDATQGLGVVLQSLGDPESKELLQFAARYDLLKRTIKDSVVTIQTDQKIFYKLGEICESLNRREEARVWYQLAIGRDPLDTQAHQGLTRLNQASLEKKFDEG